MKLLGTINEVLDVTDRLLTKYFVFGRYWDFKRAYDSVEREVLYNILTEFGIPKKLD